MRTQCPECHTVFNTTPPKRFVPPTLEEVKQYCSERRNSVDPQKFLDYYESSGWMRGKTKITRWKSCVNTWEKTSLTDAAPTGKICPLCSAYRLLGNEIVCGSCRAYCRKCGEGTARLVIVRRKDRTMTAICHGCLTAIKEGRA